MGELLTAQLQKVQKHPSKFGGDFYYLFFKDTTTGKTYRSCVSPSYRNWSNWRAIVENFNENQQVIVSNLVLKGNLIDADSRPIIQEQP